MSLSVPFVPRLGFTSQDESSICSVRPTPGLIISLCSAGVAPGEPRPKSASTAQRTSFSSHSPACLKDEAVWFTSSGTTVQYLIYLQLVTLHPAFLVEAFLCLPCTMLLEAEQVPLGYKIITVCCCLILRQQDGGRCL